MLVNLNDMQIDIGDLTSECYENRIGPSSRTGSTGNQWMVRSRNMLELVFHLNRSRLDQIPVKPGQPLEETDCLDLKTRFFICWAASLMVPATEQASVGSSIGPSKSTAIQMQMLHLKLNIEDTTIWNENKNSMNARAIEKEREAGRGGRESRNAREAAKTEACVAAALHITLLANSRQTLFTI